MTLRWRTRNINGETGKLANMCVT